MATYHKILVELRDEDDGCFEEISKMVEVALLHNLTDSSIEFTLTEYEEEV